MNDIADRLALWREHPAIMVRELFGIEPDLWQVDVLEAFPHQPRIAMKACAGPGKTATLAWIAWNFMLTRPHPRVGCTSINSDNLKSNLWAELALWRSNSPLLERLFEMTKGEIYARESPETWKMEARTWARDANAVQIGNALRGLHSKYVMWVLDETGDYPSAVLPTCENIFAGLPAEAHIVQAGNPTKLDGPLYHAHINRDLWAVTEITADPDDPKRTPRVSVEHARNQIRTYGRDNPWIVVNVFGQFPPQSINALIGPDEVRAAMKRYWRPHEIGTMAPKILGVDVARYGDDSSIIFPRQGIQAFAFTQYRNLNSTQGAGQVAAKWDAWDADAAFVDNGGGYGSGWIDNLARIGKAPIGVDFGGSARNNTQYANKRAEMAFDAVAWIKAGGALPESEPLLQALTLTTYTFDKQGSGSRMILEPKEEVKKKMGGRSPDEFDGFILTFAEPVSAKQARIGVSTRNAASAYKPFAELDSEVSRSYAAVDSGYDPFKP